MGLPWVGSGHRGRAAGRWLLIAAVLGASGGLAAQPLARHPQATLEVADLQAEWARLTPAQAEAAALNRQVIAAQAEGLLVRRVLAQRAQAEGLADDPVVQRQLQLARERILSDAWLARLDARTGTDQAGLEAFARARYQGQPQRFEIPEQVRVRHILLRGEDAPQRARQLLEQLRAGADFATLARQHSQDPGSAAKGGDLGFFARGRMVPEFERAAFALEQPGELSEPVQTAFGVHLLKLEQRRAAGRLPFEEVRAQLVEEAAAALRAQTRSQLRDEILKDAVLDAAALEALVRPSP